MKTATYKDLLQTISRFVNFVKNELNLEDDLKNSWIEKAINYVDGLTKTLMDKDAKSTYLSLNNQNLECLWSLIQLQELKFIYENLIEPGLINEEALKSRIKKIIKAPLLPVDEDETGKNEPRNFLFELLLLGELLAHGLDAKIKQSVSDHPDIEVKKDKRYYAIECKRIFKTKAFLRNFKDAKSQLENFSLNKKNYFCGIIALNVTRAFNEGDKLFIAQDEKEAENKAFGELEPLFNKFKEQLYKNYNSRIPALFLHLSTPVVLKTQQPPLAWGHYLIVCELARLNQISLFNHIKSDFSSLIPK